MRFVLGGRQVEGRLEDISRSGLKLRATDLPPVACTTLLELALDEDSSAVPGARVKGQVMWTSLHTAGIRFVEPRGDFVEQLERLLRGYLLAARPEEVRSFVDNLFDEASFAPGHEEEGSSVLFDLGRLNADDPTEKAPSKDGPPKKRSPENGNGSR